MVFRTNPSLSPLALVREAHAPTRGLLLRLGVCAAVAISCVTAQQVRVQAPLGAIGVAVGQGPSSDEDPGKLVEMFENPNLDNYLHRAQQLLERQDYVGAVGVLQEVIEGRTVEVVATRPEDEGKEKPDQGSAGGNSLNPRETNVTPGLGGPDKKAPAQPGRIELDARNSVFSHDSRLYRPVRRLCHELLSEMPEVGIEIYRTTHEPAAEELFEAALANGSAAALEQVANRYFITLPAGRAMLLLADRMMHDGRYRAAVQVLQDLLEVYPARNRKILGIRDTWCQFKIALCLRLAGERDAAQASIEELAGAHPEESLRIRGELESIKDLPTSKLFARDTVEIEAAPDRSDGITWLADAVTELTPMWQFRFADPEPYRDPKPTNRRQRNVFFSQSGPRGSTMPWANRYGPATWVGFSHQVVDGHRVARAMFLEHFRLRMCDLGTGVMLRETEAPFEPPTARDSHPRARIAAADQALLRPVEDELHRYVVLGYQQGQTTNSDVVLKASELVAYDRSMSRQVWTSATFQNGVDGFAEVTFLAAPTVFGECLLVPALRRNAYTLECLDRHKGTPLWHTLLHAGGSKFFKAPGCPVEVQGGVAYVATNAGCVAAVDAFAGELRWIRRYERYDLLHKRPPRKKKASSRRNVRFNRFGNAMMYGEDTIDNFMPSDLMLHEGLLILAPVDGEMILALDLASGEPVWSLDGHCQYSPYGNLNQVIGKNDRNLFALSETHLVCIGLEGGLVQWQQKLPTWNGQKHSGRGRGVVHGSTIVVPNMRQVLLFDADNKKPMRTLRLPAFDQSKEPINGSCNLAIEGPWLAVGYQGGVEVYSTEQALGELAGTTTDPLRRAHFLTLGGKPAEAEKVLADLVTASKDERTRSRAGMQLLALVRRRATAAVDGSDATKALGVLDEVRERLSDRPLQLNWLLTRVEICKAAGDLRAHEQEQQRLYDFMERQG